MCILAHSYGENELLNTLISIHLSEDIVQPELLTSQAHCVVWQKYLVWSRGNAHILLEGHNI